MFVQLSRDSAEQIAQRKGGVAEIATRCVLSIVLPPVGRIKRVRPLIVRQFRPDMHHGDPLFPIQPVPEGEDMILVIEVVVRRLRAFDLFADVVLEEPDAYGLRNLVSSPQIAALQLHEVVPAPHLKGGFTAAIGKARRSRRNRRGRWYCRPGRSSSDGDVPTTPDVAAGDIFGKPAGQCNPPGECCCRFQTSWSFSEPSGREHPTIR